MPKIEYRLAKQNSYCRACDKENSKDKDMVFYFYSIRNYQDILICPECIKEMYNLINKVDKNK
jgi:hypothetical protein